MWNFSEETSYRKVQQIIYAGPLFTFHCFCWGWGLGRGWNHPRTKTKVISVILIFQLKAYFFPNCFFLSLFLNLIDFLSVILCFVLGSPNYEKGVLKRCQKPIAEPPFVQKMNQLKMPAILQFPSSSLQLGRIHRFMRRKNQVKLLQCCDLFLPLPNQNLWGGKIRLKCCNLVHLVTHICPITRYTCGQGQALKGSGFSISGRVG